MATVFNQKSANQFRSKTHGFGKAKKRWVCMHCLFMHETKVTACVMEDCFSAEIIYCDSEKEAKRYQVLRRREDQGRITDLEPHPPYLFRMLDLNNEEKTPLKYVADFRYRQDGKTVVEDVKPKSPLAWTDSFKIKKRLMKELFNIEISIVTKEDQ